MNRQQKIQKLQKRKAITKPETKADFSILLEALESAVEEFAHTMGVGVDINKVDELINSLKEVRSFHDSVDAFQEAVKAIPPELKVASLGEFLTALKQIKIQPPDVHIKATDYTKLIERFLVILTKLDDNIKSLTAKPGQKAEDFLPYRRVVKKGNIFIFDDMPTQAGGISHGGGGSSAASGGLTDTELRASPVPVQATIDTSAIATSDIQTNRSQKSQITDGTDDLPIGGVLTLTGTETTSGDRTILSVAGGTFVKIYHISFVPTSSATVDQDVVLKVGTTARMGWRTNFNGGGFAHSPKNGQAWIEGADGEDIVLNLSAADPIRYNITYGLG